MSYIHINPKSDSDLFHVKRGTLAFDPPKKEYLEQIFLQYANIGAINMGLTKCHPKDQYKKSTGRELADQRKRFVYVHLSSVEIRGTKHIYHFVCEYDKENYLELGFSTIKESENVNILYATLN